MANLGRCLSRKIGCNHGYGVPSVTFIPSALWLGEFRERGTCAHLFAEWLAEIGSDMESKPAVTANWPNSSYKRRLPPSSSLCELKCVASGLAFLPFQFNTLNLFHA
jgi:hypothetical protein